METGRKINEIIDEKQKEMMEGFIKMVSPMFGEENCNKWYFEFLEKDESFLDQFKKGGE